MKQENKCDSKSSVGLQGAALQTKISDDKLCVETDH